MKCSYFNHLKKQLKFLITELDELYDEFSHWLDDPGAKNSDQRDVAVFRFAHGLLKRALSDSFASVAMNIESLAAMQQDNNETTTTTKLKDIKGFLSSSATSSAAAQALAHKSRSLDQEIGDQRVALLLVNQLVNRKQLTTKPEAPSADGESQEQQPQQQPISAAESSSRRLACHLVSIIVQQSLAQVELELQVPRPRYAAARSISINHNNSNNCQPKNRSLRSQESLAWEYHQNPSCTFNIRLAGGGGGGEGLGGSAAGHLTTIKDDDDDDDGGEDGGEPDETVAPVATSIDRCAILKRSLLTGSASISATCDRYLRRQLSQSYGQHLSRAASLIMTNLTPTTTAPFHLAPPTTATTTTTTGPALTTTRSNSMTKMTGQSVINYQVTPTLIYLSPVLVQLHNPQGIQKSVLGCTRNSIPMEFYVHYGICF